MGQLTNNQDLTFSLRFPSFFPKQMGGRRSFRDLVRFSLAYRHPDETERVHFEQSRRLHRYSGRSVRRKCLCRRHFRRFGRLGIRLNGAINFVVHLQRGVKFGESVARTGFPEHSSQRAALFPYAMS